MKTLTDIRNAHLNNLKETAPGESQYFPSGFESYDELTGGFVAGEFVVLGARTGMGKTSYAIRQTLMLLKQQIPVLYLTLDMTYIQLYFRFYCQITNAENLTITKFLGTAGEFAGRTETLNEQLRNLPLLIHEDMNAELQATEETIIEFHRQFPKRGMVVIDYLQNIHVQGQNREREISQAICRLKVLARTTGKSILCLSQLSRAVEVRGGDKRPQLTDLKESGSIEQAADKVIFLHRPEFYGFTMDADGNDMAGVMEVYLASNKIGRTGSLSFIFSDRTGNVQDAITQRKINLRGYRADEIM